MTDSKIVAAKPAMQLIRQLVSRYGPLEFRISGSCVEGFMTTCVHGHEEEVKEERDYLGFLEGCPVYWQPVPPAVDENARFVLHVEKGKTNPGSLEASGNVRFLITKKACKLGKEANPHMFSYLFGYSGNWG